jgi:hypothetical protein
VGICPANPTTPSKKAEPVSRYTSQLVASRVIHVPISEMLWPPKYKRKFRCRSDRHAREMPGLLTEEEVVEEISALTRFHCPPEAQGAGADPTSRRLSSVYSVSAVVKAFRRRVQDGIYNAIYNGIMPS